MIIKMTLMIYITAQTVIYQFDANSNLLDDWQGKSNFLTCGIFKYFGSNGSNNISRIFLDIEPHSHYRVDVEVLSIDSYKVPKFYIDNTLAHQEIQMPPYEDQICGKSLLDSIITISIFGQHNRGTLWVSISLVYGGLKTFKLSIIKCQYGCEACIDNYPESCAEWKLHQYSLNKKLITFADGWNFQLNQISDFYCGQCQYLKFQVINYFTELPPHKNILLRFYKRTSFQIVIDYVYGFQITTDEYYKLTEILIKNHPDPILKLNIYTQEVNQYSLIRDFELFYSLPEINFQNFFPGCLDQINNQCLICQEGWSQDEFLQNCQPICGDKIIQGQEECEDGNQISNDGCFRCQFSCDNICKTCQFGICQECETGFILNIDNICIPLCGDGILIPYSNEKCEIESDQDECKDCQFTSIPNCKTIYFSNCLECYQGFFNLQFVCYPYCGDKLILEQYEDCDDGNLQPYDGCFECKFQCIEGCNICDRGQCILKCLDGYEFINNSCLSICGDVIITQEEDCDDGNTIEFDGCLNCKYSCPLDCLNCQQGTCLQYQNNDMKLQMNCGDGLLQEQEQCDDGSDQVADGCKNCQIEENWKCITISKDSRSQCNYVKTPDLIIYYLNMTQNYQYIKIQFSQQVKIYTSQPLSQTITFELINITTQYWNSSLQIIQDVGQNLTFGEYIIMIEILQLLDFHPVLKILINQPVFNSDNTQLNQYQKSITLKNSKYLNENQIFYSQLLKKSNKYLTYGQAGIATISLLFGKGQLFIEILSILQFQQYLRYINLQFPLNLEIYFTFYDLITVQPLLDFIKFPLIFKIINIKPEYSQRQLNIQKQNSNLFINLSPQIIQCLLFLSLIFILKCIKNSVYNKIFCPRYFEYMSSIQLFQTTKIVQFNSTLYKICLKLIKLEQLMSNQGLQKLLLLNSWDVTFKIFFCIQNIQIYNYLDILKIFMAIMMFIIYFGIAINPFKFQTNFTYSVLKMNQIQRFEVLNYIRQVLFLLFLTYTQNSQILQLGQLILTSVLQIKLIYYYRNIFEKYNYIVQMIVELSVLIFMLSSFLYIQEFNQFFNEEKKILLGWFQTIILSQGIFIKSIMICLKLSRSLQSKCQTIQDSSNNIKS